MYLEEAHQGVMTDRRHSLKRGDRLSKKERQTTASDCEKATNCDMCYGLKVIATFITIKQATKQLQNERQATWVTPLVGLLEQQNYHNRSQCLSAFYNANIRFTVENTVTDHG